MIESFNSSMDTEETHLVAKRAALDCQERLIVEGWQADSRFLVGALVHLGRSGKRYHIEVSVHAPGVVHNPLAGVMVETDDDAPKLTREHVESLIAQLRGQEPVPHAPKDK